MPLTRRASASGQNLGRGACGTREPMADAPEVYPDILVVPLAAFDRKGNRIGYGAGYYDMTIRRLRSLKSVTAVGLAPSSQEGAPVPAHPPGARPLLFVTHREAIVLPRLWPGASFCCRHF